MKKFLAFFLAITVVLSMTAMFTTVGASGVDSRDIPYIDYLDFSSANNRWSEKDSEGNYIYTSFKASDYVDDNGLVPDPESGKTGKYYPFALRLDDNTYDKNLDMEFMQNGEVLRLTATDTTNPGIAFQLSTLETYNIGKQDDGNTEYIKIRFKNNSPSTKITFMGTNKSWGNYSIDSRIRATIEVEPNSADWQTVTISMVEGTQNTTGTSAWASYLKALAIFPFGYGNDNEAIANDKYYMEIDYVVVGSKEYVDSYQSELEKKENAAESFEYVQKPTKTEYLLGETIDLSGLVANIKYTNDSYPEANVDGNSISAVYNFDKPLDAEGNPIDADTWTSTVMLKYGPHSLTYDVTVYDITGVEFEYETDEATDVTNKVYDRISILQAGDFTPTGIKVKVTYAKTEGGINVTSIKEMYEVDIEGADFSDTVEATNGYFEYLVTLNYHGHILYLPVKLIDVVELVVTPVADKAGSIYYGTEVTSSYFDIVCKYSNGDEKTLADSGLSSYLSVSGNTKNTGGETPITVKVENSAYNILINTVVNVTVQTPVDISVKLAKTKFDVDKTISPDVFTIKYTYADGTTATVDQDDPNLVFKYDTSVPGENHTGVVEIGNKKANFTFTVKDAEFETDPIDRAGEKVTLLAPKFPTSLIVTFICAGVVILLVAAWAVLKFVFKVDFKRKKRVSLDDIF